MIKSYRCCLFLSLLFFIHTNYAFSQHKNTDTTLPFKTIGAGSAYKAHGLYKWFWGSNYRNLWTTPVAIPVVNLDTMYGGLAAYAAENTGEAKTVFLKDAQGREYLLVAVNSTPGSLIEPKFKNTIIESRVNDAVSITNPYAGITLPALTHAAGAYVQQPLYLFVPKQAALKAFSDAYGDDLYKLVPAINRPASNYIETGALLELLANNASVEIDKQAYIRERLLDMFVNDWNRGEDKWRWTESISGNRRIYTPVTTMRDAAYTKYDGKLTRLGFMLTQANLIQSFDDELHDVNSFNFKEKDLDRRLLNEATSGEWQTVAASLQQSLTDSVIEAAVNALPKEIFAQTGSRLIAGLKARRSHLTEWASTYYNFLAKETEIPGTNKDDVFEVRVMQDSTIVQVFDMNNGRTKDNLPYYSRAFYPFETKEIRLFGLAGMNNYTVTGDKANGIQVRIISSGNADSLAVAAGFNRNDVVVYGSDGHIKTVAETNVKIVRDTSFKLYNYSWYNYDKNGVMPVVFYSNQDRLFAGLEYRRKHYAWGKSPFASTNAVNVHYSLMERAFSTSYKSIFPKLFAKTDLSLYANYDDVRWSFFFGLGNNTTFNRDKKIKYYTVRTREWLFQPALVRSFGRSTLTVFGTANGIKVIDDTARFLDKSYHPDASVYKWQTYAGGGIGYKFQRLNDPLVPTKGLYVDASAAGFQNLATSALHYFLYSGNVYGYIPLSSKFSLNIRAGGQTVTGNPEFYQYASLGGTIFRGTVRDRFRGRTSVYNSNDIRFITPVHTRIFAGKAGLLAFVDNGRVWMPGESSNGWHTAYGGGIILAPFNLLYADFNLGFYKNERSLQVRVTFFIP